MCQGFFRVTNPSSPLPDGSRDPRHVYHVPHSLSHSLVSHFALPRPVIVIYFQYIILQISFNMSWAGTNCTSHVNVNSPVVPLHFLPEYQGPLSIFSVPYILPCHGHWPHNSGKIKYNRYTQCGVVAGGAECKGGWMYSTEVCLFFRSLQLQISKDG